MMTQNEMIIAKLRKLRPVVGPDLGHAYRRVSSSIHLRLAPCAKRARPYAWRNTIAVNGTLDAIQLIVTHDGLKGLHNATRAK